MNEIMHYLSAQTSQSVFTDVHIEQGKLLRLRTPNGWEDGQYGIVGDEAMCNFLARVEPYWKNLLRDRDSLNLPLDIPGGPNAGHSRFRCCVYTIDGNRRFAASLRRISPTPIPLEETGVPPLIMSYVRAPKGLLLVTGSTGSGKTTTIMSLLARILERRNAHVVTIEDPIEYVLPEGLGIVSQREVGIDTKTFASGLHDALRQRPDVIMVGEIRDKETAVTAVRAAESGHFVVATLHARSAIGALQKMQAMTSADENLGSFVVGVLAQSLVPSYDSSRFVLATELISPMETETQLKINSGKWESLEDMLKRGDRGFISLNDSLSGLVKKDLIRREEAMLASYDPQALARMMT